MSNGNGNGNGNITFDSGNYGSAQGADHPPNPTVPDLPPTPGSPIDAALAVYHAAANGDDPANDAELAGLYGDRETQYADDLAKFPANEDKNSAQMAQAFPEIISGIAGAVTGAIGGLVAPLTQIPQAAMQAGQGALQTGMGALQQAGGDTSSSDLGSTDESMLDDPSMYDDLSAMYGDSGGGGGGGGTETGGGGTGTTGGTTTDPTSALAPPPMPISTFPAAAAPPVPSTPGPTAGPPPVASPGMGMPYMPMGGAGAGATGAGTDDKKPAKKVVPPVIKNSKAIGGRLPGTRLDAPTVRQTNVGSLSSRTAKRQPQQASSSNNDEGEGSS